MSRIALMGALLACVSACARVQGNVADESLEGGATLDAGTDAAPASDASDGAPDGRARCVTQEGDGGQDWFLPLRSPGVADVLDLAVDSHGNSWIVGAFRDGIDFGDCRFVSTAPGRSLFVAELDPLGHVRTATFASVPSADTTLSSIAVGPDDSVYVFGEHASAFRLGSVDVPPASGVSEAVVARFSPEGEVQWVHAFGHAAGDVGNVRGAVSGPALFIAGNMAGSLDFGPAGVLSEPPRPIPTGIPHSVFYARLSFDGDPLWAKRVTWDSEPEITSFSPDGRGGFAVSVFADSPTVTDCGAVTAAGVFAIESDASCRWQLDLPGIAWGRFGLEQKYFLFWDSRPGSPFERPTVSRYSAQGVHERDLEIPGIYYGGFEGAATGTLAIPLIVSASQVDFTTSVQVRGEVVAFDPQGEEAHSC